MGVIIMIITLFNDRQRPSSPFAMNLLNFLTFSTNNKRIRNKNTDAVYDVLCTMECPDADELEETTIEATPGFIQMMLGHDTYRTAIDIEWEDSHA